MQGIIDILAVVMAVCAIGIVSVGAIRRMIWFYQVQSVILAFLTVLAGLPLGQSDGRTLTGLIWRLAFAISIPGFLAYTIEPLLVQATVQPEMHWGARIISILRISRKHRFETTQRRRRPWSYGWSRGYPLHDKLLLPSSACF